MSVMASTAGAYEVGRVRFGGDGNSTRIVFDVSDAPEFFVVLDPSAPTRLRVSLTGLDAAAGSPPTDALKGVITDARFLSRAQGRADLEFDLKAPAGIRSTFVLPPNAESSQYRLVIDIEPVGLLKPVQESGAVTALPIARVAQADNANEWRAPLELDRQAIPISRYAFNSLNLKESPAPRIEMLGADSAVVAFDAQRLTLTQSHKIGAAVVGARKHISAAALNAAQTWRSELDAVWAASDADGYSSEFTIGFFDTQRPLYSTKGGIGFDDFNRWRGNSVVDASYSMTSDDGNFTYAAGLAASETSLRFQYSDEPWLWLFEPDARRRDRRSRSTAMFQKLGATVIETGDLTATIDALYTTAGQEFRNFQTNTVADILYEGETFEAAAKFDFGETKISLEKEMHDDLYYAFDRNILRFSHGALALKATIASDEIRDGNLIFSANDVMSARVRFDLAQLWSAAPGWLPDDINFGASQRSSAKATLFNSADAVRRSFGVGMSKSGDHFLTDIYVYWNARNDFSDEFGPNSGTEFGADIVQTLFFDDWDFSIYATMSDLKNQRRLSPSGFERLLSGGASFSKQFEHFPDIRVSLDAFQVDAHYVTDDYAFANHDLSLRVEADVSEMLLTGLGYVVDEDRPMSIYVGAYNGWGAFTDSYSPTANDNEFRLLLMLRRDR